MPLYHYTIIVIYHYTRYHTATKTKFKQARPHHGASMKYTAVQAHGIASNARVLQVFALEVDWNIFLGESSNPCCFV